MDGNDGQTTDRDNQRSEQPSSPEEAARALKEKLNFVRDRDLMDLVEKQRRLDKKNLSGGKL